MDPLDPILDQPQVIDYDEIDPAATYRLANQDLYFDVDANSDLHDLFWPWADSRYVRHIRMQISDPHGEGLMTLVTRYYPGYQETILGREGMIISKRLAVPLASSYDRAALWMLECQAEGDLLVRLDIEIDWGEPLTQRIVDGLLVAQLNPRRAQGVYAQRNADLTCVFGNPYGRPSSYEFDDQGHAHLSYYILINGIVEVPLLLTISDVGEQVAWNGFLAMRDAERAFELSVEAWDKAVKTGRLWTPHPQLNRALQAGRLACLRRVQRMRTGLAPASRQVCETPALVKCLDACDVTESRNVLAHVRRLAEKSGGRLPELFPVRPQDELPDPGAQLAQTNSAYLMALRGHMQRHPDADLLARHYDAATACAEALVQSRWQAEGIFDEAGLAAAALGLHAAAALATQHGDSANAVRWESESAALSPAPAASPAEFSLDEWPAQSGWQFHTDRPWGFIDPLAGIKLAGDMAWAVSGLHWTKGALHVEPASSPHWWALLDLPLGERSISLVWDGDTLHSTSPVHSSKPVALYDKIRAVGAGEFNFDLRFEMQRAQEGDASPKTVHSYRPRFASDSEPRS